MPQLAILKVCGDCTFDIISLLCENSYIMCFLKDNTYYKFTLTHLQTLAKTCTTFNY